MAKRCEVCGKGPQFGNNVSQQSHASRFQSQSTVDPRQATQGRRAKNESMRQLYQGR
jgi:ribosomal protein L28